MKPKKEELQPVSEEYKAMLDLLEHYTEASNEMARMQHLLNKEVARELSIWKDTYADLSVCLADFEAALEIIARKHPEWFLKKKSVKTPFGTVKFHKSTTIEIANEEATVLLIEGAAAHEPAYVNLIKTVKAVDREVLESFDDVVLARFRCRRVDKENFSVEPAKVDMGKAISTAEQEESRTALLPA